MPAARTPTSYCRRKLRRGRRRSARSPRGSKSIASSCSFLCKSPAECAADLRWLWEQPRADLPYLVGTDSHLLLRGVTNPLDRGGAYRNRALRRTARRKPRPRVVANRGAAMNTRNVLTGFFLVVSVVGQGAIALSRAGESSVRVRARGPAGLRIEGKSSQIDFEEDASAPTFKVPIAPIETGIGLRDRHLREALEAEKFPAAILRVSRSELTFPKEHDPAEGTAQGDLTLHGRSRPVQVRYRAERGAAGVTRVHGSVQLDMHDFEIKSPSYLGVSVTPQVEVTVEMAVEGA